MELMAEVVDIECTSAGVDQCGRVSGGYIVLRGPVGFGAKRPQCYFQVQIRR